MAYVFDGHRAIFAGFTLRSSISRLRTTTWNSKLSYDSKLLYNITTTSQPHAWIRSSRFSYTLPFHKLIPIVWALVCATAPPVRLPAKASAILNESVTAVTASRFSPVFMLF